MASHTKSKFSYHEDGLWDHIHASYNPVCTDRLSLMKLCTVKYCSSDWRSVLIYCLTLITTWLFCEISR